MSTPNNKPEELNSAPANGAEKLKEEQHHQHASNASSSKIFGAEEGKIEGTDELTGNGIDFTIVKKTKSVTPLTGHTGVLTRQPTQLQNSNSSSSQADGGSRGNE